MGSAPETQKTKSSNSTRQPHEATSVEEIIEGLKRADFTGRDFSRSLPPAR